MRNLANIRSDSILKFQCVLGVLRTNCAGADPKFQPVGVGDRGAKGPMAKLRIIVQRRSSQRQIIF